MEIKAPAKINLFLNVGKKRVDNFHEVYSIMVNIGLYDKIILKESDAIQVTGPDWLPEKDNLIYKAVSLFKDHTGYNKGCNISVDKGIPPGRGLGGGSSDAAKVLLALNRLWGLDLDISELEKIGSILGSDINFFLYESDCLVKGRGELVIPISSEVSVKKDILVIDAGLEISTKVVYEKVTDGILTEESDLDKILDDYRSGNWATILRNDLEDPVFKVFPVLKDLKKRLKNWGVSPLLSGSGSCMFALSDDKEKLISVARILNENFDYNTWIVNSL